MHKSTPSIVTLITVEWAPFLIFFGNITLATILFGAIWSLRDLEQNDLFLTILLYPLTSFILFPIILFRHVVVKRIFVNGERFSGRIASVGNKHLPYFSISYTYDADGEPLKSVVDVLNTKNTRRFMEGDEIIVIANPKRTTSLIEGLYVP